MDSFFTGKTILADFMRELGHSKLDYNDFWRWSVDNPEKFWDSLWNFAGIIGEKAKPFSKMAIKCRVRAFFPMQRSIMQKIS